MRIIVSVTATLLLLVSAHLAGQTTPRTLVVQCAADALGARPLIVLGFPDGALGDYTAEPGRLVRLRQRLHAELQRLHPDALVVWGPDGGPSHPDHKLVSNVVTQLVRAGAPGVPARLFYA